MKIVDQEKHERVLFVAISKEQLEGIIERAISEKSGIAVDTLRKHGKLKIENNMEGSPAYQHGHKATFQATIPLKTVLCL